MCTYTFFADMPAFFRALIPARVADQLIEGDVCLQTVHFILSLFEYIYAQMETAAGTRNPCNIFPVFRQCGRFSTTAGDDS